jgi:hypothetical protein
VSSQVDNIIEYDQRIRVDFDYWDSIIAFADTTGCNLVWDLCALSFRSTEDNSWNSTNAEMLFDHMVAQNQSVYAWQLGNEPGHWKARHPSGPDGAQLARDYVALRTLVTDKFQKGNRNPPLIFGPDTCGPAPMTEDSPCSSVQFFTDIIGVVVVVVARKVC